MSSENGTSMVSLTRVGQSSSTSVYTAASLPGRLCLPAVVASAQNMAGRRGSGGYGGQVYGSPPPWSVTTGQASSPHSVSGRIGNASPSAAACSDLSGSPRTSPMIMTAMAAPMTGPAIYTHQPV